MFPLTRATHFGIPVFLTTAILRYLMQRDHTDSQFKHLSENLETQEAKLEGARGALLRHEKATTEQARSLQYRVLAVEKGLEAAEKEKATREELLERFEDINYRLREELSLDPIRADLANIKIFIQKLKEDKVDVQDIAADREKAWLRPSLQQMQNPSLKLAWEQREAQCETDAQSHAAEQVRLAAALARQASACCADLPEVSTPSWWEGSAWPPAELLMSLAALAREAVALCRPSGSDGTMSFQTLNSLGASGERRVQPGLPCTPIGEHLYLVKSGLLGHRLLAKVDAVMAWAELAAESCSVGAGKSLDMTLAVANISAAVALAASLQSQRLDRIHHALENTRPPSSYFNTLTHATSSTLFPPGRIEDSEPALLVRFFCAAAATALLELRAIVLATHTSWIASQPEPAEPAEYEVLENLRLSADFLQPRVVETSDIRERLESSREPLALAMRRALEETRQEVKSSAEALLVLDLPMQTTYSQVLHYVEEVQRHLPEGMRILFLEEYFLKHGPQLSMLVRQGAMSAVEVVFRPAFGLHHQDADLWEQTPSLAKQRCALASSCWRARPCEDLSPFQTSAGERPADPGCWFRLPNGCPRSSDAALSPQWRRDTWGEAFGARDDVNTCLELRRHSFNQWCGITDAQMHFVRSTAVLCHKQTRIADVLNFAALGQSAEGISRFHAEKAKGSFESYLQWHAKTLALRSATNGARALVWGCQPALPCGGHGDRLKGIVAAFILAVLTGRLFLLDAPDPWDLQLFLQPKMLDWRVAGLAGLASGRHVLWDHDHFEDTYLSRLLEAEADPVWVIYTNKKSLLGPMLRHPGLAARAEQLDLLRMPHLTNQVWSILFEPTDALERHYQKLQGQLGEGFIALHHRSGDMPAGFGIVNGEVDVRSNSQAEVVQLLTCAHYLERYLNLPQSTRWYLASDNPAVVKIAQVQNWQEAGKLVLRNASRRAHLATEGLVPPCGSIKVEAEKSPLDVLPAAASLSSVADAWVDFLAISRASAAVVSSSAFSIMAAEAGGQQHAFSSHGCVQVDLLT
ncbi:unnamed protein product [Effrenium voratum]|nr:unnamed protein product [Effrenium voratum]